jgi:hypothetical protein
MPSYRDQEHPHRVCSEYLAINIKRGLTECVLTVWGVCLCVGDTQELTVFASVNSTSDVISIKETAVQAGAAYVGEGCYCQFGNELVQVVSLLHEGETFLVDEIDDKSQAIRLESTLNPELIRFESTLHWCAQ